MAQNEKLLTHVCKETCFFENTIYYAGERYAFPSGKKLPKHFESLTPKKKPGPKPAAEKVEE